MATSSTLSNLGGFMAYTSSGLTATVYNSERKQTLIQQLLTVLPQPQRSNNISKAALIHSFVPV